MPIARHLSLITLDGVKDLIARNVEFRCRYELFGGTGDGKPRYKCIYSVGDEELILVVSKVRKLGPEIKLFALWPGLVNHHVAYGDVGAIGSTSGIPGAPLVIMYQNEPLGKTRPTMAFVFTFSYITSLVALTYAGAFNLKLAMDGLMLLPGLLIGFGIGRWARRYITQAMGRILMLSIASTGAILLLIKSAMG